MYRMYEFKVLSHVSPIEICEYECRIELLISSGVNIFNYLITYLVIHYILLLHHKLVITI